jgi:hypothetical protein
MTQRKRKRSDLKRLRRQAVESDFDGGTIASDGGLVLLREVDRKLDLMRRIDEAMTDPRDQRYVQHSQRQMITSRIFGIAAGYEDANDHQHLRNDPAFQVAAEQSPSDQQPQLASPATLSRLENRASSRDNFLLHEILVDTFLDSFDQPPAEIILDMDATNDPTHGDQENKFFNGFYDGYCFLPLYVFCGDQLLVSYLRPSSVGCAKHARPICKLLVNKIRSRWPVTRIILRGDSGFCNHKLLRWCDKNDVGYVIGLQKNPVLLRRLQPDIDQAEADFETSGIKQRRFTWFPYKARRWDGYGWVIGKAEHTDKGSNTRFVITNLPESTANETSDWSPAINPGDFYDGRYCPRGEMENRIKEQQLYLFADRTSCTDFMANQLRLMFSSFAYVLLDGIRRLALHGTKAARWRVDTIRLRLIKIAARVKLSVRRVVFHLCSNCPNQEEFKFVLKKLCDSS